MSLLTPPDGPVVDATDRPGLVGVTYLTVLYQLGIGGALLLDVYPPDTFAGARSVMPLTWWGAVFSVSALAVGLFSFHGPRQRMAAGWTVAVATNGAWAGVWWKSVFFGGLIGTTAVVTYTYVFFVSVLVAYEVARVRRDKAREADDASAEP